MQPGRSKIGQDARVPDRRTRSRQAERTEATKRKLLAAAKRIFARDGFEAARLEDIAAGAGYTRGAFYANFESKEDIFFALLEEWVRERIESVTAALRQHKNPLEKLAALRKHYAELAKDRRLVLISLEFKLFALRHPEAHARLRDRHRRIRASWGKLFSELLQSLWARHFPLRIRRPRLAWARWPRDCCSNIWWIPKHFPKAMSAMYLGLFFDSIFQVEPQHEVAIEPV